MGRLSICTEFSSIYPTFKKTKRAQLLVKSFICVEQKQQPLSELLLIEMMVQD